MLYKISNENTWRDLCTQMSESIPRKGYTLVYTGRGFVSITHPDVFTPINVAAADIVPETNPSRAAAVADAAAWLASKTAKDTLAYA